VRYRLIFILSTLTLLWERFWNRFWPGVSVVLFFAGLALFNLPLFQDNTSHLLTLAVFAIALAVALIWPTPHPFSFPSRDDVERRIEQASGLEHRPLQTLRDDAADGSRDLWHQHKQNAALALNQLKIYKPHTGVARRDRWHLRYIALAFLVIGLAAAQRDAGARLSQALTPDYSALVSKQTIALDLWITPPEYTHEATIFLATSKQGLVPHEGQIEVPSGSLLKLRLSGTRFAPSVGYAGKTYDGKTYDVSEAAPRNYTLEMPLRESGTLKVGSWINRLGQWPLTVLPDTPPQVSISKIEGTAHGTVKITYKASDDHGVTKLTGIVAVDGKSTIFDMPPTTSPDDTTYTADLAANPAAGQHASMWLEAADAVGHKTDSAPFPFVLPERHFSDPLAQRIIAERKILLSTNMTPDRRGVAQRLADITNNPGLYKSNIIIFMALNSSIRRLLVDKTDDAAGSAAAILWDVAVRLEDNGLSLAQRDLSDSLQKLSQMLNDKSMSREQLQEQLDEVKKKMQEYVQALALQLQQKLLQGQKSPTLSPELAQKFMKNMDLSKMLDQMRALNQANSREDLQKLAASLKDSLDNLDMDKFNQLQEKQMQMMQGLQNIEDIIHRQQALFDKTNNTLAVKEILLLRPEQNAIRTELGADLQKIASLGLQTPDNFAKADQAMTASAGWLGKGSAKSSLPEQKTALDELQKGLDSTMKKLAESMQQSLLSLGSMGEGMDGFGEGYDPLGRPNGKASGEDIKLPSEDEHRRVQEIIDELRHRSNETTRPKVERDYIDRLLDQF
jgi:uncharacterized protein (TIGR02302 family)